MELVGITKDVLEIVERYMSTRLCPNTIGQVKRIADDIITILSPPPVYIDND